MPVCNTAPSHRGFPVAKRLTATLGRVAAAFPVWVVLAGWPAAGYGDGVPEWTLVPDESRLEFVFTQAGSEEQGHFERFDARFHFDPDRPADSGFEATVDMASVETGDDERDALLRSEDLFAVKRWPRAEFSTLAVEKQGGHRYRAEAELTIRDRTRKLPFPFELRITENDGDRPRLHLTAEVTLKRLDYGVGQGDWADTDQVPDEVRVKVDVTARRVVSE